jgi:hypothetical protein
VVPEVARELLQRGRVRRRVVGRRLELRERLPHPELVVEQAVATRQHRLRLRGGRELAPGRRLEEREVDVLAGLVQHAALHAGAESGRLEEGEDGLAERRNPAFVLGEPFGIVDEEDDVQVGPAVRGVLGPSLRADDERAAHVLALARPVGDRGRDQVHARVDVHELGLVDVEHERVHAAKRELVPGDALLELREQGRRVRARERAGLRHRARRGESAQRLGRDQRDVDREREADVVRREAHARHQPEDRSTFLHPVLVHRERELVPVGLPDGEDLVAHVVQRPPRTLRERLAAERGLRLRGAEPLGRAPDEENPGYGEAIRHGSV